jgi:hypothetical protein
MDKKKEGGGIPKASRGGVTKYIIIKGLYIHTKRWS